MARKGSLLRIVVEGEEEVRGEPVELVETSLIT